MAGVNKAIVVGNLGQAPEVRRTQAGAPVVSLSVATSENWKDKSTGEKRERTEWHRVVIFNEALCDVAEKYLKKGSRVYVEGKMQTRKYTDAKGIEKYTTEVVLTGFSCQLVLLDRATGDRPPPPSDDDRNDQAPGPGKRPDLDDEIPF